MIEILIYLIRTIYIYIFGYSLPFTIPIYQCMYALGGPNAQERINRFVQYQDEANTSSTQDSIILYMIKVGTIHLLTYTMPYKSYWIAWPEGIYEDKDFIYECTYSYNTHIHMCPFIYRTRGHQHESPHARMDELMMVKMGADVNRTLFSFTQSLLFFQVNNDEKAAGFPAISGPLATFTRFEDKRDGRRQPSDIYNIHTSPTAHNTIFGTRSHIRSH